MTLSVAYDFCEIFRNTFFHRTPLMAVSVFDFYTVFLVIQLLNGLINVQKR